MMQRPRSPKRRALRSAFLFLVGLAAGLAACLSGGSIARIEPRSRIPAVAGPLRLALLVGVGDYDQSGPRPWGKLNTHRDIAQLKEVLLRHLGFEEQNILTLEDAAATAAGIRKAFRSHLIDKAVPGAVVVFHFSGHGQQLPDDNGDEFDGLDESLVPQDARSQLVEAGSKINIRDDEVGAWLREVQAKLRINGKMTGSINVFLDSCYSGTATRGLLIERGRGWDVSLDGARPKPRATAVQDGAAGFFAMGEPESQDYVVLSATQSDQTAKELGGMGAFTRALVAALSQAEGSTTYRALHDKILVEIAARVRDQTPEIEGPRDQLLFSGIAKAVAPYLVVSPLSGELVTLPVGELHGATALSVFAIHRPGSEPLDDRTLLAEATIEKVEPFSSTARLTKSYVRSTSKEALTAARAVEKQHVYQDTPLLIHLSNFDELSALRAQLEKLDVVTTQDASASHYQLQIERAKDGTRLELRRQESATPFAAVAVDARAFDRLEQLLRGEWRWLFLSRMQKQNPYVQATLRFVPVRVPMDATGNIIGTPQPRAELPPSSHIKMQDGDSCMLEIHNDTVNDIYVTVLELNQNGSVAPVFPSARGIGDNLIPGGQTVRVPPPFIFQLRPPLGRTLYKVIATADKIDLSSLVQTASRELRSSSPALTARLAALPGVWNPLGRLLAAAALGRRDVAPPSVEPLRWGVTDSSIDLRPRTADEN